MNIPNKQNGLALLILVFILALAITTYTLKSLDANSIQNERDKLTVQALAEAKMALIGYAITYDDEPSHSVKIYGYLPCPDTDASDIGGAGSQPVCGSAGQSVLGRLPWKTLKVSPIKDGYEECLWYAVSGSFKNNPKQPVDPTTLGQLKVQSADGGYYMNSDVDPIVAVVIAPGPILDGQTRSDSEEDEYCGGNYIASNYLDSINSISNADATDSTFVLADTVAFNDQLILIKQSDVFKNYCGKYARKLANMINLTTSNNDCNVSGSPSVECIDLRDSVQYCTTLNCQTAANTLIASPCLGDPSIIACQSAVNDLRACNV